MTSRIKTNRLLWAYLSLGGELMPSTIREKPGDAESALEKTFEFIMKGHRHREGYKLIRVAVSIVDDKPDPNTAASAGTT